MTKLPGQMRLLAMLSNGGHHLGAWRHPLGQAPRRLDLAYYQNLAAIAERGRFDALFIADVVALWGNDLEALSRTTRGEHFEPLTLLSALAATTQHIGLIATATTSYNEPYHIARKFASIDHLSRGRAGWNVVTSVVGDESRNFGRDAHFAHADRYARAEEFVDVVRGLWDSWEDDAIVADPESGCYFDPSKLHALNHHGTQYDVAGPLNISRPPQGHPVLVQAGASETGRTLAGHIAELVFVPFGDLEAATRLRADLRAHAASFGRDPDTIRAMPGVTPFIGRTRSEAQDLFDQFQSLVDPVVGLRHLADNLGDDLDLSGLDIDGPLPDVPVGNRGSRRDNLVALAKRENLSLRQLYLRMTAGNPVIGTGSDIADALEHWFEAGAADGFNVFSPHEPAGLEAFVDTVVPELQRRGLFRRDYEGATLRDNLGLVRPARTRKAG